jgi:hypothetical protein
MGEKASWVADLSGPAMQSTGRDLLEAIQKATAEERRPPLARMNAVGCSRRSALRALGLQNSSLEILPSKDGENLLLELSPRAGRD